MAVSAVQQELFEELDAFNPRWRNDYATTEDAAKAAGAHALWIQWCLATGRGTAACNRAPDVLGAARALQAIERHSRLPFKLDSIGAVRTHSTYRED